MKKLLITSALAGSLLVSASASAEMKVKGYLETTLGSGETPATSSVTNQGTSIGYETGVTFSGTKDLDNGMSMTTKATLEDNAFLGQAMAFSSDGNTIFIGNDYHGLDDKQTVPTVANMIEDGNKGLGVKYNNNAATIHSKSGVGVMNKSDMGTIALYYVPKVGASVAGGDSNPGAQAKSGSGLAIGFQGSLGVEGLGVNLSRTNKDTDGLDASEITMTNFGAKYNYGSLAVGAQRSTIDDANLSEAFVSGTESEYTSYGATYAVSDALSVGVQYAETSLTAATSDEEVLSYTVGYNLGGQVVSVQFHDVENKGTTKGTDGQAVELRIKSSF
jgi:hypothetical protein